MKCTLIVLVLFTLFITPSSAAPIEADVCIYGGTSAGVIAAVQVPNLPIFIIFGS